MAELGQED